jgi:7,8-dihydropterin-6-yl-methyl-4-(beta-D-ribofuranosyl)aminobenzene 5'-phosphate synthase
MLSISGHSERRLPRALGRGGLLTLAGAAALVGRYVRGRAEVEASDVGEIERRLTNIGEVDSLEILPLVERLVARPGLRGEPGVSYLLRAGEACLLFDCGLARGRGVTVLEANAAKLGVSAADCSAVVVSHLHPDHVGGLRAQLARSFEVPSSLRLPPAVPAFVPTSMTHKAADIVVVTAPRPIAPGVAVLPPLSRMLFWLGAVAEQALVVNVRRFGLVLIAGCGHPRIEKVLAATEQALDTPIRAVVGGLHLPVHPTGTPLLPQAILGNPNWPWRPIGQAELDETMATIASVGPSIVALSGHDSTPWTYSAFQEAFGDRYRTLRAGEPLVISASTPARR